MALKGVHNRDATNRLNSEATTHPRWPRQSYYYRVYKASVLWPVAPSKPLLSPLLLETTVKGTQNGTQKTPGEIKGAGFTPLKLLDMLPTICLTPRKSQNLRDQMDLFNKHISASQTSRSLFRKATKGFDQKDLLLTQPLKRKEVLEAKIEASQPQKRRKVGMNPNSKFATIGDIMRTRKEVSDTERNTNEESEAEGIIPEEDYIVVA